MEGRNGELFHAKIAASGLGCMYIGGDRGETFIRSEEAERGNNLDTSKLGGGQNGKRVEKIGSIPKQSLPLSMWSSRENFERSSPQVIGCARGRLSERLHEASNTG